MVETLGLVSWLRCLGHKDPLWPPGKQFYGTCSLTPVDTAESPRSSYNNTSLSVPLDEDGEQWRYFG